MTSARFPAPWLLFVSAAMVASCAEPAKWEEKPNVSRADGAADAPAGGTGGAKDGGTGGTGGSAPVLDAPSEGLPGSCTAGTLRCAATGAAVEVCTVDGQWVAKETCSSTCAGGVCAGMCKPGEKHCGQNQTPETCSPAGEWVAEPMACPHVCSGQGACTGDCKPGTKRCGGPSALTPETCDQNGAWVAGTPCTNICSSGSCGGSCMPGTKRCGANQTPETCSVMGTWEPAAQPCPFVCSGAGDCSGTCSPNMRRCNPNGGAVQTCAGDGSGWTDTETCGGNFACVGTNCSTTQCRMNFTRCGNACIPTGTCCRATGCCAHTDCGTCQKCVSGQCVNQGSTEDLKNECASATCRTGNCNGSGGCGVTPNGQKGTGCMADCQQCSGGACGSEGDGVACGTGRRCRAGQCETCGAANQPCCAGSTRCNSGLMCQGTVCVPQCGGEGQPCCTDRLSENWGCETGNVCWRPSSGGQLRCIRCGGNGQACCNSKSDLNFCHGDALSCKLDGDPWTCEPCGRIGIRCCEKPTDSGNYYCQEGRCNTNAFPINCVPQ